MPLILPRGTLLQIYSNNAWNKVSEHNRSPISIDTIRIERAQRMANGSMRKYFIADKKRFSLSWDMLPSYTTLTVDGGWGAQDIKTFYESTSGQGSFNIRLNFAKDGTNQEVTGVEPYTVMFTDCSFNLLKRGAQAHWNVSLTMEEV